MRTDEEHRLVISLFRLYTGLINEALSGVRIPHEVAARFQTPDHLVDIKPEDYITATRPKYRRVLAEAVFN